MRETPFDGWMWRGEALGDDFLSLSLYLSHFSWYFSQSDSPRVSQVKYSYRTWLRIKYVNVQICTLFSLSLSVWLSGCLSACLVSTVVVQAAVWLGYWARMRSIKQAAPVVAILGLCPRPAFVAVGIGFCCRHSSVTKCTYYNHSGTSMMTKFIHSRSFDPL